jgi:hypothetical protein
MALQSSALEFTKVQFEVKSSDDFMEVNSFRINSIKQLRDVLNQLDLDNDDVSVHITGTTEDGHESNFRFYGNPNTKSQWYWGYVSFVLDKLDSMAERLLKQVRKILQ